MSRALKFLLFIFLVTFISTGVFMLLIANRDETSAPWVDILVRNYTIVFAWHLVCWMLLGMFTNYYWDLFNMGKGFESVQVPRILLPLMVSPFVFLPIYNLWLTANPQSYLLFEVIAVQSGFFWQALFTKLSPLDRASNIPWTVNNGHRNGAAKPAPHGADAPRP